jgi:hypothetical protein
MTAHLRWTTPATTDFLGIVEWIKARNQVAAARVGRSILNAVGRWPIIPISASRGACRARVSSASPGSMLS